MVLKALRDGRLLAERSAFMLYSELPKCLIYNVNRLASALNRAFPWLALGYLQSYERPDTLPMVINNHSLVRVELLIWV